MIKYPDVPYVDRRDSFFGQGQLREARAKGAAVRVARLLLHPQDGDDYVLLQRRGPEVNHPDTLDSSSDGYVDMGPNGKPQSYRQTAAKETREELGISLSDEELRLAAHYLFENPSSELPDEWTQVFTADYKELEHGLLVPNDEVAGLEWHPGKEVDIWIADAPEDFEPGFPLAWVNARNTEASDSKT